MRRRIRKPLETRSVWLEQGRNKIVEVGFLRFEWKRKVKGSFNSFV